MTLNDAIRYVDGELMIDAVPAQTLADEAGTPLYAYSLRRAVANLRRIQDAFADIDAEVHYSAKANANLTILRTLIDAGAGIDAVSAGEIYRALQAGASSSDIVFAGVGKTPDEIRYALEQGIGWFNAENYDEVTLINRLAAGMGRAGVRVALRLNPDVTATTHPHIATGHGAAKFGMTADAVRTILSAAADYPQLDICGIHVHIGSQLHDTAATVAAVERACEIAAPYARVNTLNVGGGFPADYGLDETLPDPADFARALSPLVGDYRLLLEPGRSIIGDAGILLARVLYTKEQGGQRFVIIDGSMTELIRPALYDAAHHIVPVTQRPATELAQVVGPVCETTDIIGRDVPLPPLQAGDVLAILTAGAYGAVMASNYNARLKPAEVAVMPDGENWRVIRRREIFADLIAHEA